MKRLFRILLNALTVLSVVLWLSALLLWVHSYSQVDYIYYSAGTFERVSEKQLYQKGLRSYGVLQRRGVLQIEWFENTRLHGWGFVADFGHSRTQGPWDWGTVDITDMSGELWLRYSRKAPGGGPGWREPRSQFGQFGYGIEMYSHYGGWASPSPGICRFVTIPYWSLALILGFLPLARFWNMFRGKRRAARGLRSKCGYDLRATPERCPECGAMPANAVITPALSSG